MVLPPQKGVRCPFDRHRTNPFARLCQAIPRHTGEKLFRRCRVHIAQGQPALAHLKAHVVHRLFDRDGVDIAEQVFNQLQICKLQGIAPGGISVEIALADVVGSLRHNIGQYRNDPFGAEVIWSSLPE